MLVLRSEQPQALRPLLDQLLVLGVGHVEIAWSPHPAWVLQCRQLIAAYPTLRLGAASVCTQQALADVIDAGFGYAVSPILDRSLIEAAGVAGLGLVPGVLTPSEVHSARSWGCPMVKLFPATSVGPGYWRRLVDPLGHPLPFCLAAGGLGPQDVLPWLAAGVDAIALGSGLLTSTTGAGVDLSTVQSLLTSLSG